MGFKDIDPKLQEELHAYQKDLEAEFKTETGEPLTEDDLAVKVRSVLVREAPAMLETICNLAKHSGSDAVRASCAKYVVSLMVGKDGKVDSESALEKFLKEAQESEV